MSRRVTRSIARWRRRTEPRQVKARICDDRNPVHRQSFLSANGRGGNFPAPSFLFERRSFESGACDPVRFGTSFTGDQIPIKRKKPPVPFWGTGGFCSLGHRKTGPQNLSAEGYRALTAASSWAMAFSSVARGQAALSRMNPLSWRSKEHPSLRPSLAFWIMKSWSS